MSSGIRFPERTSMPSFSESMPPADSRAPGLTGEWKRKFLVARSGAYIAIILTVVLGAGVYGFRERSVFNCQASGYGSDRYLAYCGAPGYGDYDYGAFWFGLEPAATEAATDAQVLFVGNSRMQFALSAEAMDNWFESFPARYYLLGFAYNGNYKFEAPLLRKLGPTPKVYVINLDLFFEQVETPPARQVMRDESARSLYERKREWQSSHKSVCISRPAICGDEAAFFRSRATGAWAVTGGRFRSKPVSYDQSVDQSVVEAYATSGREFLSNLTVDRECQILTMVPTVDTGVGTAKAIALALGRTLIAPELSGLNTFDESHLDRESAERWSTAFLAAAGPRIRTCLTEPADVR
jgi:hypothetical protein